MAITAWSAKVWSRAICLSRERPDLRSDDNDHADRQPPSRSIGTPSMRHGSRLTAQAEAIFGSALQRRERELRSALEHGSTADRASIQARRMSLDELNQSSGMAVAGHQRQNVPFDRW